MPARNVECVAILSVNNCKPGSTISLPKEEFDRLAELGAVRPVTAEDSQPVEESDGDSVED